MTTNPVSYVSVDEFLAAYKSYPDGAVGNNTTFGVSDFFDSVFLRLAEVATAATYIHEHGNDLYLQLACMGSELQDTSVADLNNLVPAEYDSIIRQKIELMGQVTVDAAHMRAIIDNQFLFTRVCEVAVADTASNIASIQQYMAQMTQEGWFIGAANVTTHVVDTSSALQALSVGAIHDLVAGGVTHVDVIDDQLELGLRQYRALSGLEFAEEDRHVVRATQDDDHLTVVSNQWTRLHGGRGDDRLVLGAGGGEVHGGRGQDHLVGGSAADEFAFAKITDSSAKADKADVIGNFEHGDIIRLAFLDGVDDRPSLNWIGGAAFSCSAGEVRFDGLDDGAIVRVDSDGDGKADFSIVVHGTTDLGEADFAV